MITVSGTAKVKVDFSVDLDMTIEEFDALSERKQNELLDAHIDWMDACRDGEADDFEVDDIEEMDDEEESA